MTDAALDLSDHFASHAAAIPIRWSSVVDNPLVGAGNWGREAGRFDEIGLWAGAVVLVPGALSHVS